MGFKNFRLRCLGQVLLLCLTLFVFFYLLFATSSYASLTVVGVIFVFQVVSLIRFVEKSNRQVTRFLESIEYFDFSQSFTSGLKGSSFDELNAVFNRVLTRFRDIRMEKEENARYLETVVRHVGIGLIGFYENGEVALFNTAAKQLFDLAHLRNIENLSPISGALVERLKSLKPGRRDLLKVNYRGEMMQLSMHATDLRIHQRKLTLVSVQNISGELSEKEMEAWQNLIRVLTHEIKNSLTPIGSLASTVEELLGNTAENQGEQADDIRDALRTIQKRSRGLLHFVEAYRDLTHIPAPEYKVIQIKELFTRVQRLTEGQVHSRNIRMHCTIDPPSLELTADPELVEQVMINLILNAVQALDGHPDPVVTLDARLDNRGRVVFHVRDNGPGIDEDVLEQIFIPFYSTKPGGSGIGLSLSRQIMRQHHGDLIVESVPDEQTTFTMRF